MLIRRAERGLEAPLVGVVEGGGGVEDADGSGTATPVGTDEGGGRDGGGRERGRSTDGAGGVEDEVEGLMDDQFTATGGLGLPSILSSLAAGDQPPTPTATLTALSLNSSQKRMVHNLNTGLDRRRLRKHVAWFPRAHNSHAVIVVR
jgi:hypothetical protein